MLRMRPGAWATLIAVVVVLAAASGIYALQRVQLDTQCAAIAASSACATVYGPKIGVEALFVAIAGLLAAIVMAITTGVNWRTGEAPNTALARQLQLEENAFQREQAHLAQLKELREVAVAHVQTQLANAAAVAAARAEAGEPEPDSAVAQQKIEDDKAHVETADEARRRVLAERFRNLARTRPEAVARVVQAWVDQR